MIDKSKLYYLGHPYTSLNGKTPEQNLQESIELTNDLMNQGLLVFNPLTHSHYLHLQREREPQFWYDLDLEILKRCDGLILTGNWRESKGCMFEFEKAKEFGLEITEYKPNFGGKWRLLATRRDSND